MKPSANRCLVRRLVLLVAGAFAVACGTSQDIVIGEQVGAPDSSVPPTDGSVRDATGAQDVADGTAAVDSGREASAEAGEGGADATTDASSPPDAAADAPFDASSVMIVLWLDAARGLTQSGGFVSAWADQTSFHNDAAQSTATLQPTLLASGIHGLPVVHFDEDTGGSSPTTGAGAELDIADALSLQWSTGEFYVAIVGDFDNPLDGGGPEREIGLFYGKSQTGSAAPSVSFSGNVSLGIDPSNVQGLALSTNFSNGDWVYTNTAYNDGTPHLFSAQREAGTLQLRVDGAVVASNLALPDDVGAIGVPVTIGSGASGRALRLDGDIAEMLAVKGPIAQSDRAALEQYLLSKYGL